MQYEIARRTEFDGSKLQAMHTLRAQVFKYKKGWDVTLIAGMEIDGYDALNPFYMLINSQTQPNDVQGCWRLLPTTGPYMLKDTFPELLAATAPEASDVWELSRFAVAAGQQSTMQFSNLTFEAIKEVISFGIRNGIKTYVTVTTVGIERMLLKAGLEIGRLGTPLQIGVEKAVALTIDLGDLTRKALGLNGVVQYP